MREKLMSKTRKKWTTPVQRKENDEPVGKGQKRKRKLEVKIESVTPKSKRPARRCKNQRRTLGRNFNEMIESPAQSIEGCPHSSTPLPCSVIKQETDPLSSTPSTPLKIIKAMLDDICTPASPIFIDCDEFDAAPSPLTPPLPLRLSVPVMETDEVPSPQGMNLTAYSSSQSPHFVTQSVTVKQEPAELDETPLFDAQDTSLGESAQGLDLDCLIDELFVENFNTQQSAPLEGLSVPPGEANVSEGCEPDVDGGSKRSAAPVVEHDPLADSDTFKAESKHKRSGDPLPTSPTDATPASLPVQLDLMVTAPEAASCGVEKENGVAQDAPTGAQLERSEIMEILATLPDSNVLTDSTSWRSSEKKETVTIPDSSSSSDIRSAPVALPLGNILEEFLNEDLALSESQFLDIDAKCLMTEDRSRPSGAVTSEIPVKDVAQDNSVKSSELQARPPVDGDFLVPSAPCMDWVQKIVDSRQRLRSVTQEVSRLNAMVLRARRTLWPRQQQSQATLSQTPRLQPIVSQEQLQQPQLSNMNGVPDWNFC